MSRKLSSIAPDWWDYTTLDSALIEEAARLTPAELQNLTRDGFRVVFYDTLEDFYLAEALEYLQAWREATPDRPAGICGPIGPTEQLPLVARLVNELRLPLHDAHFWGIDEWYADGREVPVTHPLSFERADRELCFSRIRPELAMPEANLHFPKADLAAYTASWRSVRCVVMQGGQGDIKHWAFNDPCKRDGAYRDAPPSPGDYRGLAPGNPGAKRADFRRWQHRPCAAPGDHGWACGNLEGREGVHLARRPSRQPFRPAAHHADGKQAVCGYRRAHVVVSRPPQRAIQFLPWRHWLMPSRDALRVAQTCSRELQ